MRFHSSSRECQVSTTACMSGARLPPGRRRRPAWARRHSGHGWLHGRDRRDWPAHVGDRCGRRLALEELPALPRAQPVPEGGDPQGPPCPLRGVLGAQGRLASRCRPGRRSGSSGPTGRARARCSSASPGSSSRRRAACEVNGRISALLELGAGFHPELSGRENVFLNGAILGLSKKEIAARFDDIVDFAGLADFIDTPVKNYSSGMFVRLGFAVAANVEPEVLLIDEVLVRRRRESSNGAAWRRSRTSAATVARSSSSATASSQVGQLCEDAAWIDKGDLRMIGPALEVISEYQGTSHEATRIEGEQGARWGSGEGQIVDVTLLDGQGQPGSVMSTFEPMTIKVELTAHSPLQDVVVGIGIHSLAGTHVWGSNTKRNGQTHRTPRRTGERRARDPEPAAARRRLRPHRRADRPHRGPPVRLLGQAHPLRGPPVPGVRRRTRAHPWRLVGEWRQGDGAEQPLADRSPGVTASTTPFVRVVVINFDGWQMTIDCLESLLATDWPADRLEIVMVDNGSLDDVVERVRAELPAGARHRAAGQHWGSPAAATSASVRPASSTSSPSSTTTPRSSRAGCGRSSTRSRPTTGRRCGVPEDALRRPLRRGRDRGARRGA